MFLSENKFLEVLSTAEKRDRVNDKFLDFIIFKMRKFDLISKDRF